jgi:hypothetical protein
MKQRASFERVREQYLDTETGKLVWVTSEEAASGRIAYGELIPIPEPNSVTSPTFHVPYIRARDRQLLALAMMERPWDGGVFPDEAPTYRVAVLKKETLVAGPYLIRVWRQA